MLLKMETWREQYKQVVAEQQLFARYVQNLQVRFRRHEKQFKEIERKLSMNSERWEKVERRIRRAVEHLEHDARDRL